MQPSPPQAQVEATTATDIPGLPPVQDAAARQREEIGMLLTGFFLGLSIAGVFLVYLVLEYAKLLP